MTYPYSLKLDILNILNIKTSNGTVVLIHNKNKDFFEELLKKESDCFYFDGSFLMNLNKLTSKDVITLKEYLDYINMIEN